MRRSTATGALAALLAGLVTLGIAGPATAAAPPNDNLADATVIEGPSGTVMGTNVEATTEAGEPAHVLRGPHHSVWWRWTAPTSGAVFFDTEGSVLGDTVLAVQEGTALDGPVVAADDDSGAGNLSRAVLQVVAGTTYSIVVDSWSSTTVGAITLNWGPVVAPANDDIANATVIEGATGTVGGTNRDATTEPGEQFRAGQTPRHSVWWRWTASTSGPVRIDTEGSALTDTVLAVQEGTALDGQVVAADDDSGTGNRSVVVFEAVAGTTYSFVVDSATASTGTGAITVNWRPFVPPANDDIVNATLIEAASGTVQGSNVDASVEAGEPSHAGRTATHSVWWRWTAPSSGPVFFDTEGSALTNTVLAVQEGTALDGPVVAADDNSGTGNLSRAVLQVVAGTTYSIVVDSAFSAAGAGPITVNWGPVVPPANDDIANATLIEAASGTVQGSNVDASAEAGEPWHADRMATRSVWWRWTAPTSGAVAFDTEGSALTDTVLAVQEGTALDGPVVATDDNSGTGNRSRAVGRVVAGTTYSIVVDSANATVGMGAITLNWGPVVAPANDDIANATVIEAPSGTTTGTNVDATVEPGEPLHAGRAPSHSVWWRWTAPTSGSMRIDTEGSALTDTVLAVQEGTALDGPVVAADDNSGTGNRSVVVFEAVAGTTYSFVVDSATASTGTGAITVNWRLFVPPANDDIVNATPIEAASGTVQGSNVDASAEAGEPWHAGRAPSHSVWWRWTAPTSGAVAFDTEGSALTDTVLAVQEGTALTGAVVAADDNAGTGNLSRAVGQVVAGTTYSIVVDSWGSSTGGAITLNWNPVVIPVNDDIADATVIEGPSGTTTGTNLDATAEPGEPLHAGRAPSHSVWWRWTAPTSGAVAFDTEASALTDTVLAVQEGTALDGPVVAADDNSGTGNLSRLAFEATEGQTYSIVVDAANATVGMGAITLSWAPVARPANDDIANATVIEGAEGTALGTNWDATAEPMEAQHVFRGPHHSVWWRWTAPESGVVNFDTEGSGLSDTVMTVQSGAVLDGAVVADDDDSGTGTLSSVWFTATAGTTYSIVVDSYNAAVMGSVTLNWRPVAGSLPTAPPAPVAIAGDRQASAAWESATSLGSGTFVRYEVAERGTTKCTVGDVENRQCTAIGLVNGQTYQLRVRVVTTVGSGPWSELSNVVMPGVLPAPPPAPTATAGDAEASISWLAPEAMGSGELERYEVTTESEQLGCESPVLECAVTGLTNGAPYRFKVRAVTSHGVGPWSELSNEVTPQGPPPPPDTTSPTARMTAPTGRFVLATAVRFRWTGSDNAGGSGLDHFVVRFRSARYNAAFSRFTTTQVPAGTRSKVQSIPPGTTYCYSVRAVDVAGNSPAAFSPERCTSRPLDDRALNRATSGWTVGKGPSFYMRTFTKTTAANKKLTRTGARLKWVALVATKCRRCGAVTVKAGGVTKSVSLFARTTRHKQLIVLPVFPRTTGTVSITTSRKGKQVIIDGLGISRM